MTKFQTITVLAISAFCSVTGVFADTTDIREWLVPWEESLPGHASVDANGRVWFIGEEDDYIANFSPETNEFNRYDLPKGTNPTSLLIDAERILWFASNRRRYIGALDPSTGRIVEIPMPNSKARDPFELVFDQDGDIWFTVMKGNFIGQLKRSTNVIELITIPTKKVAPHGIVVDNNNNPWSIGSEKNVLLRINRADMLITEIQTPNSESRFRHIVAASDNTVWYADYALGMLGSYNARNGQFSEWALPGGADSKPLGMIIDRDDRIWLVETGHTPNRLIGFDTGTGTFLTETDIPSSAGSVSHMYYHEPAGEVWFGTATNYIGRAKIH